MSNLYYNYFPSYKLGNKLVIEGNGNSETVEKSLLCNIKLLNLTGFDRDSQKIRNGIYSDLICHGELKIFYCLTQNIPYLDNHRVGPWNVTKLSEDDRKIDFSIELPLPYNALFESSGICLVLSSTITKDNQVEDYLIAGANMPFYNNKGIFRHGIYEINMHPISSEMSSTLEKIERLVPREEFSFKNAKHETLNKLLARHRKMFRSELYETPLDKHSLPDVERGIEKAKLDSNEIFLGVKIELSRDFPDLFIPVVFSRPDYSKLGPNMKQERWNPVDEKYLKMTRNIRTSDADRGRQPNNDQLEQLKAILNQSLLSKLSETDSDLIWHYRFYLMEKYPDIALGKFMMAVRWEYADQSTQALELLKGWPRVESESVLILLTKHFPNDICRSFAVQRLQSTDDQDLDLYLYPLVQALRYESMKNVERIRKRRPLLYEEEEKKDYFLAEFLLDRAVNYFPLANNLYWHLKVELEAAEDRKTPECEANKRKFSLVFNKLLERLREWDAERKLWHAQLESQDRFVQTLVRLLDYIKADSNDRKKQIELLRMKLAGEEFSDCSRIAPDARFPFMLDPSFMVAKVDPCDASVFSSKVRPALLTFLNAESRPYRAIFKVGDDLRQDQFVLQMVRFMDTILKRENFDLHLTPYRVLATGTKSGFVQYIESKALMRILTDGSIQSFLKKSAPNPTDYRGVKKEVMENYVRSCAGYCVITYLLGVGDRHFENIMLTTKGALFHIDFGFILGYEPTGKALVSSEVRLNEKMIDAMGGLSSPLMIDFWRFCHTCFILLRRHANQLMIMFALVADAGIMHIQADPQKACDWLKDRFWLDLSEDEAGQRMLNKLNESLRALGPELLERFHSFMQFWRN